MIPATHFLVVLLVSLVLTSCASPATEAHTITSTPVTVALPFVARSMPSTVEPVGTLIGKMVFTSTQDGNYEIYSMNADGSHQLRLTNRPEDDYNADLSPDGNTIAFTRWQDGDYEIYVMHADGSSPHRLTFTPGIDDNPAWSPDSRYIAFTSHRDGNAEIYVMNADGTEQHRLTQHPDYDVRPAWSPDGQRLVFESARANDPDEPPDVPKLSLYIMNQDGSHQQRLTTGEDTWVAWSPDGQQIAFTSYEGYHGGLYLMRIDGTEPVRIKIAVGGSGKVAWSPDGRQLAFTDGIIYLINIDGTEQHPLTTTIETASGVSWRSIR